MAQSRAATGDDGSRSNALDLMTLLLRRRRLLIGLPLAAMLSAFLLSFLLPHRYTVESRFMPEESDSQLSQLAGLAGAFGVNLPTSGATPPSLDFYGELVKSPELLRTAALGTYRFEVDEGRDSLRGNLVDLLHVKGDTPAERVRRTVDELDELVTAIPQHSAGLILVSTSAPWPELAVQLNQRLLDLLTRFNMERRQTRAAAEHRFLEGRVGEAQQELRRAEQSLERFLSENRKYQESPALSFQAERLRRDVDLKQQVYVTLSQALEQARVDEVRNTPVLTIVDPPRGPARRTSPHYLLNALLGLLLGLLVAAGVIVSGQVTDRARRRWPDKMTELEEATHETLASLRPRWFFGRFGGGNGTNGDSRAHPATGVEPPRPRQVEGTRPGGPA